MITRLAKLLEGPLLWLVFFSPVCQGSVYTDSVIGDGPTIVPVADSWDVDAAR